MCGRYASSRDPADLALEFEIDAGNVKESVRKLPSNYNVAPTDPVLVGLNTLQNWLWQRLGVPLDEEQAQLAHA